MIVLTRNPECRKKPLFTNLDFIIKKVSFKIPLVEFLLIDKYIDCG